MQKDSFDRLEDLLTARTTRAAAMVLVTLLLALTAPYPLGMAWTTLASVLFAVGLLSYGDKTIGAALVAPAFFLLLNIVPPEFLKSVAMLARG